MFGRIRRPSPALVVALIALFVALGGTAVAAGIVPLAKRALVADNAKTLQGQNAAALVQRAAQQPGPASSASGLVSIKTAPWSLPPNTSGDFTATCDSGQKAIGGGWSDPGDWASSYQTLPTTDDSGWTTNIYVPTDAQVAQSGTVYVVCER